MGGDISRPAVANVHVLSDFRLRVEFDNGETRIFDAKSYIQRHKLKMLKSVGYFALAFPNGRAVEWPRGETIAWRPFTMAASPSRRTEP